MYSMPLIINPYYYQYEFLNYEFEIELARFIIKVKFISSSSNYNKFL